MAGHARQQSDNKPRTTTTTNTAANDPTSSKPKLRTSCDGCQEAKLGCSQEKPTCRRCLRHGTTCVYSPFRRIGRPRKSTNPRSTTTAKPRSKNGSVDERHVVSPIERQPDVATDAPGGGMKTLPVPPSSPASTDNGCGSWYPWSTDGTSLSTMNMDVSANFMDGLEPFPNTIDYLDLGSCFDTNHDMLMNYPMPLADDDIRPSMQPTPPSSIDDEMSVFGEAMTRSPTQNTMDSSPIFNMHQQSPIKALKTEAAHADFADLNSFPSNAAYVKTQHINPISQRMKEELSNNPHFASTPSLSPSSSISNSPPSSPCNKRCSTSLMQQLASLSSTVSDTPYPSIDTILSVDRDTSSLLHRLHTCKTCVSNRSNHLLFSMVVEQIIGLFETLPNSYQHTTSSNCSLQVGNFRVDDSSAKAEILKRLLLSRFTNLDTTINEFSQMIDDDGVDYNTKAAREMLGDVHQRLDVLRDAIERW